jgi:hypothetical protein
MAILTDRASSNRIKILNLQISRVKVCTLTLLISTTSSTFRTTSSSNSPQPNNTTQSRMTPNTKLSKAKGKIQMHLRNPQVPQNDMELAK